MANRKVVLVTGLALAVVAPFATLAAITPSASAATTDLYVAPAPTGSDTANDCSVMTSPCATIQHAITEAGTALTGGTDVIVNVAAGTYDESDDVDYTGTGDLTIAGVGATTTTVDAAMDTSVFEIQSGNVTLSGLTITGGAPGTNVGGGVENLGATVDLSGDTVTENTGDYAGGVYSYGTITLTDDTVSHNMSNDGHGGGGLDNEGMATLTDDTFAENTTTTDGGGVESSGTATLTGDTLDDNSATVAGGGLFNSGVATLANDTLSDNSAGVSGGGVYTFHVVLSAFHVPLRRQPQPVVLTDNNLHVHTVAAVVPDGTVDLTNDTLSGNVAPSGSGIQVDTGGTAILDNNIFEDNTTSPGGPTIQSCNGTVSGTYNVEDDATCSGLTDNLPSSTTIDLGLLGANGGPTMTEAITTTSSAYHLVPVADCPGTDQRGVTRPQPPASAYCDAGAFEVEATTNTGGGSTTSTGSTVTTLRTPGGGSPPPTPTTSTTASTVPPSTTPTSTATPGSSCLAAAATASSSPATVSRVAGASRDLTAIAISQADFPQVDSARAVVLARNDLYADGLVGVALAAKVCGPLLLTPGRGLDPATATEISRVLPPGGTVYLLGGTAALSASVTRALTNLGYHPVGVSGPDRFATAVAVAGALGSPSTVLLATGVDFTDALAAGPAAIGLGGAVLLTNGSIMPASTAAYLKAHPGTVFAVGGPACSADPAAECVDGADRFATAVAVANQFFPSAALVGLASGVNFPDSLAGGVYTGVRGGPVILVPASGGLPSSVTSYLTASASSLRQAAIFGGTAAVGADVAAEIVSALGG